MSDNVFRTSTPEPVETAPIEAKDTPMVGDTSVEVPYFDYEAAHGRPLAADYFNLGDTWNDPEGGFPKELEVIQDYVKEKITTGRIANSVSAVQKLLKNMEQVLGIEDEERSTIKIDAITAYIEFLKKTGKLNAQVRFEYN